MSDILEGLQSPRTSQGGLWPYPNLHDEAADEITRLREELAAVTERMSKLDFERTAAELERDALREENARLQKATTPICVGRRIIGILAEEGAWTSENGASVIAADELFGNDPYKEITRLREENARLREERDKAVEEMWKASDQAQAFRKMAEERKS